MRVLVINCGSSSLKYALYDTETRVATVKGLVERIGTPEAVLKRGGETQGVNAPDHTAALEVISRLEDFSGVDAIGHRVVHGGTAFTTPTIVNEAVLQALEDNVGLAPLHNPPNLAGIRAAQRQLMGKPNVGVFDTGFHATLPERAYRYAIPRALGTQYRRYGFHGTSHGFVALEAARFLGQPLEALKIITLHLGNGASACAVQGGRSVDTTMGFTPLEGLVMGTRSGDVDAGLVLHLARRLGVSETDALLNKQSGLLGLSGSSDLRDVWNAADDGDEDARVALEVTAYRIRKTIGAYTAAMNGTDAIVFTAGAGENDARLRARVLEGLDFLGVTLDIPANARGDTRISTADSRVATLVIPTNEELAIALETARVLLG
ncbi:MAG: acetate kinase [Pleurocapsa sp. SU_196_0]|nr:acetate kinase [Pleurocapsa sp. SU_196_0]